MIRIYLDHNATTPLDPRVRDAMLPWLGEGPGNPSSPHAEGRRARRLVEDSRDAVAALLAADPREVVFTSGATEANNLAIHAWAGLRPGGILVSAVEHPSVREPIQHLALAGRPVSELPVGPEGRLREEALAGEGGFAGAALVAVMAANNEIGAIQPFAEVASACAAAGVPVHIDAVQAVGKIPFDVSHIAAGSASISGHKIGGPMGIGALWLRSSLAWPAILLGGGQERGRRAGTENVPGIAGLGEACRLAQAEQAQRASTLRHLEEIFLEEFRRRVPEVVVHGPRDTSLRLPGTLSLRVPGVRGEHLLIACDLKGVAISLGSACSSGAVQPSHVLAAMGKTKVENLESVRLSLGWQQEPPEIRRGAALLAEAALSNFRRGENLGDERPGTP